MRGAPALINRVVVALGIIPAYAGSTAESLRDRTPRGDHPRVCGEHAACERDYKSPSGSSPRMRGAHLQKLDASTSFGIIPAYAGSTSFIKAIACAVWDHPRVCGEHVVTCLPLWRNAGSSPRMRGALKALREQVAVGGIIPAYAGSTDRLPACGAAWRDHPRVCGEHAVIISILAWGGGSSPRMRGAPIQTKREGMPSRIIPAYAGSTRSRGSSSGRCRDHPRVCGEHCTP